MTRVVIIEDEPDDFCELCGEYGEVRPYGPKGEKICYECGMKNPEITVKMFKKHVLGECDA